jgi:hypothetical protein
VAPITEDKADRSFVLDTEAYTELPLEVAGNQRVDDTFLELSPGVVGNTFTARLNGGPDQNQDFYYDGAPYMNADGGGRQEGGGPPVDAVDEYSVVTNAYSAQYGRAQGGLNFHMRSGTNQLHAAGWDYVRNNDVDARGFYSPGVATEKQNEYGFRVGGPVDLGKLYNGKDRTFFFGMIDWFKSRGGLSLGETTLPTQAEENGDFSGVTIPIFDPLTNAPDGYGGVTRTQFAYGGTPNIIDPLRESVLSKPVIALVPTAPAGAGFINNVSVLTATAPVNNRGWEAKMDHNFTSKLVAHASYYHWGAVGPTSPVIPGPLGAGNNFDSSSHEPRLSADWTIKPNLQNQIAGSYQWGYGARFFFPLVPSPSPSVFATPNNPWPEFAVQDMPGFGAGNNNGQISAGCWPCAFIADNLKWIKGRHSFTFGTEMRWEDEQDAFASNLGVFSFGNGTTSLPDAGTPASILPNSSPGSVGWGFAGFYGGWVDEATKTSFLPNRTTDTGYRALYAQDDIKVSSRLTLNLGVRWEWGIPAHDDQNMMSSFDPTVSNPAAIGPNGPLLGAAVFEGNGAYAAIGRPAIPCVTAGSDDMDAAVCTRGLGVATYYKQIDPRIGFAYKLNDKTVVRGGFGTTGIRGGASTLEGPAIAAQYLDGFQPISQLLSPDNGFDPPTQLQPNWDTYFANGMPLPPLIPLRRSLANNDPIQMMQHVDDRTGYVENWSLTVERKLPKQIVYEISYVGSTGVRLGADLTNLNQTPTHYMYDLGSDLNQPVSCLANNTCPKAIAAGVQVPYETFPSTGGVGQALRPYPQFLSIDASTQMDGHSNYHSLQMRAQKYFSDGITFLVSFTWFKNLANAQSAFSPFYGPPLDNTNTKIEKSEVHGDNLATGPLVLSIAGVYDLPIGPGKKFVNQGGAVGKILGGWELTGILTYDAGDYLGIGGGTANPIYDEGYGDAFFGGGSPRPNQLSGANPKEYSGGKFDPNTTNAYYLNPSAFADAGEFNFGTAGPALATARGFPYENENIGLVKKTKIAERLTLELRFEFFNIFNRTQFCDPDGNYSDVASVTPATPLGAFGRISCQNNTPRQGQFGIRLEW